MIPSVLAVLLLVNLAIEQTSSSVCDEITFVKRAEWQARSPKGHQEMMKLPVRHVFIHHTLEPDQCHDHSTCTAAMHWVQNFHMDTRGWDDIGYNYLMGGDQRIYEGRGWYPVGAHTLGANNISVALSIIGNYSAVLPSQAMLDLAKKWIDCGIEKGVVAADYQLHGHRDQTCTECPGDRLYGVVKSWPKFKGGPLPTYVCRNATI